MSNFLRHFTRPRLDTHEEMFVRHNETVWNKSTHNRCDGEILVESFNVASAIVAYSYLANILSRRYNSKIIAYHYLQNSPNYKDKFHKLDRIFESFNADILHVKNNLKQKVTLTKLYKSILPELKTKNDVEDLCIDGIWIGDLLYDSHLRNAMAPTIDLDSKAFQVSLKESLSIFVFWKDYFKRHTVKSVLVSHCVYNLAIILRVAIQQNIPCYQINATHLYCINQKCAKRYSFRAYNDYIDYKNHFERLPIDKQKVGLITAKERIAKRFAGEIGVDMTYSSQSAYTSNRLQSVIKPSNRIKVLIAAHCFFDSPHPYGKNLFPDFFEWFEFLGQISKITDYDWYIKTHPDFLPGNTKVIDAFLKKYPSFNRIPSETSHFQIIDEGIDFALTVYGTIGFEYAALGVPVITASRNNPHIAFNYNIHPKSISEKSQILLNLPDQKLNINKEEIYQYYYMKFIQNNTENWLFENYNGFLNDIGGYKKQIGSRSYLSFLEGFSENRHEEIKRTLTNFINSGDYVLTRDHFE